MIMHHVKLQEQSEIQICICHHSWNLSKQMLTYSKAIISHTAWNDRHGKVPPHHPLALWNKYDIRTNGTTKLPTKTQFWTESHQKKNVPQKYIVMNVVVLTMNPLTLHQAKTRQYCFPLPFYQSMLLARPARTGLSFIKELRCRS